MTVTNRAVGEEVNLAEVFNTKVEAPLLQSEMGIDAAATSNGHAVRYEEWTKRHNSDGTLKQVLYKKSQSADPSATAGSYGTVVDTTPSANYTSLVPQAIDVVFGGTFNSETVTAKVEVTFDDDTTANVTKTATATGTTSFTNADIMALVSDGLYIKKISVSSKSDIADSTATVTFDHFGITM